MMVVSWVSAIAVVCLSTFGAVFLMSKDAQAGHEDLAPIPIRIESDEEMR